MDNAELKKLIHRVNEHRATLGYGPLTELPKNIKTNRKGTPIGAYLNSTLYSKHVGQTFDIVCTTGKHNVCTLLSIVSENDGSKTFVFKSLMGGEVLLSDKEQIVYSFIQPRQ